MKINKYALTFLILVVIQILSIVIGVNVDKDNAFLSSICGVIFFILIPVNIILLILLLIKRPKKNKINVVKEQKKIISSYIIEFPFYGVRDDDYFNGADAYKWLNKEDIDGIIYSWDNLIQYMSNSNITSKVNNSILSMNDDGTCNIRVDVYELLTEDEKKDLLKFIEGQLSDGWGEGNFDFVDKDNKDFSIAFWKYQDNWYIKYIDKKLSKEQIISMLNENLNRIKESGEVFYLDDKIEKEINNYSNPFEFVQPILDIIGNNPDVDFGEPGDLVHFVEKFYNKGYEELLMKSVEMNPTAHNIWMLHNCFNSPNDPKHNEYKELINRLKQSDKVSDDIKNVINDFPWDY